MKRTAGDNHYWYPNRTHKPATNNGHPRLTVRFNTADCSRTAKDRRSCYDTLRQDCGLCAKNEVEVLQQNVTVVVCF